MAQTLIKWESITHGVPSVGDLSGNTTFVAVSSSGTNDRVMTSQDGINWTTQNVQIMIIDGVELSLGFLL